jgi:hypothetical protein
MATERAHQLKAASNQSFLEQIGDAHAEWIATVAFYKAVHLVEAVRARKVQHSTNHQQRNDWVRRQFPNLWMEYRPLYDISRLVRYTETSITARQARDELVGKRLQTLEQIVGAALAPSGDQATKSTPDCPSAGMPPG